jgi:diguanylate cyclase (GGDEF)-like protein/PAS domain S-box-containing protein
VRSAEAEQQVGRIAGLLSSLMEDQQLPGEQDEATPAAGGPRANPSKFENDLAVVRLGVATSLFYALRTKHPPTATHSVRVAIACSAWCERLGVSDETRDRIEVAALLHDIGKIGIPDEILKKPGRLTTEEQTMISLCPKLAIEILRGCTDDEELFDIIQYSQVWYRSRRHDEGPQGAKIPLGARMLAIAEAFDSMTTDHVYRTAMSRERALAELSRFAGTQFDPELTNDFHRLLEARPEVLHGCISERWLKHLQANVSSTRWNANRIQISDLDTQSLPSRFFLQLLSHTHDGVAFIDSEGTVRAWNAAMHELTGIKPDAVCGNRWDPHLVGLRTREGEALPANECPLRHCLHHGSQSSHRLALSLDGGRTQPVNVRVCGVTSSEEGVQGVVAIFQDATQQANLEQRVKDLNDQVARDPLTGVANRAEFDRQLQELSNEAADQGIGFSLVICDIDRFKAINDNYGHPAGDEAITTFARMLAGNCREGDLVARYGGEEFVLLYQNCDNATAAARAEEIRQNLEATTHQCLDGQAFTASFGVTEFQAGDTAATILARADRALLRAKDNGRNRVIQLGSGGFQTATDLTPQIAPARQGWRRWLEFGRPNSDCDADLVTPVPIELVVAKLKGFVADHHAEIIRVGDNRLDIRITALFRIGGRRRSDRRMDFRVSMEFDEQPVQRGAPGTNKTPCTLTLVHVRLRPVRSRDRRHSEVEQGALQLLQSLRSYLMAEPASELFGEVGTPQQ